MAVLAAGLTADFAAVFARSLGLHNANPRRLRRAGRDFDRLAAAAVANRVNDWTSQHRGGSAGTVRGVRTAVEPVENLLVADRGQHFADFLIIHAKVSGDDFRIIAHKGRRAIGNLGAIFEHDNMIGNAHDH